MRRIAPLLVGFAAAAVCARLGFWQLDRLGQRQDRNAVVAGRLAQPEIDLLEALPDSLRYRRVVARGTFDFSRQVIAVARSQDGLPGVYVVTPLRLEDGRGVLVERGFVYTPDARQVDLAAVEEPAVATVQGMAVSWEPIGSALTARGAPADSGWPRYVRTAEPVALAAALPYPLLPGVVRRLDAPAGTPSALRMIPIPVLDDGPHLSYALQWFSFAVIAMVGSIVLVKKGRSDGRERSEQREQGERS